jgi:hypothetical protein
VDTGNTISAIAVQVFSHSFNLGFVLPIVDDLPRTPNPLQATSQSFRIFNSVRCEMVDN